MTHPAITLAQAPNGGWIAHVDGELAAAFSSAQELALWFEDTFGPGETPRADLPRIATARREAPKIGDFTAFGLTLLGGRQP